MNKLTKAVRKEVRKRLKISQNTLFGGKWLVIHRNTAKHILQITDSKKGE